MEHQRIALVLQYLGQGFHGWQRQPNQRSVQATLEETIATIVHEPVRIYGAGRTDAGVHAAAQVAHFEVTSPIPAQRWPVYSTLVYRQTFSFEDPLRCPGNGTPNIPRVGDAIAIRCTPVPCRICFLSLLCGIIIDRPWR